MKKQFEAGDRVKVRRGGRAPFKGKVEAVTGETSIQVIEDGFYSVHEDAPFHPCQLVKLKPKPTPEVKGPRKVSLELESAKGTFKVVHKAEQDFRVGEAVDMVELLPTHRIEKIGGGE